MTLNFKNKFLITESQYGSNKYDLLKNSNRVDKGGEKIYSTISYGMPFDHVVKKIARCELKDAKFDDLYKMLTTFEDKINEVIDEFKDNLR